MTALFRSMIRASRSVTALFRSMIRASRSANVCCNTTILSEIQATANAANARSSAGNPSTCGVSIRARETSAIWRSFILPIMLSGCKR